MSIFQQCKDLKEGQQIARAITATGKFYHYYVLENDVDKEMLSIGDRVDKPKRQENISYSDFTDLLILSE